MSSESNQVLVDVPRGYPPRNLPVQKYGEGNLEAVGIALQYVRSKTWIRNCNASNFKARMTQMALLIVGEAWSIRAHVSECRPPKA